MSMKDMVKGVIRCLGYDVVKWRPERFEPALDVLPRLLSAYIEDLVRTDPDFFFIQVGAHDGYELDALRPSILAHHPRGLLVEPLPDAMEKLRHNYRSEPQLLYEQVAISDEPGRLPFYSVRPGTGYRPLEVVASFSREHLTNFGVPEDVIDEQIIEVIDFATLLKRHDIRKVGLLMIDTEGYDYRVAKSALESGIRPELILYEYIILPRDTQDRCKRMLYDAGYRFIDLGLDTLCRLEAPPAGSGRAAANGTG
jgi:FkbM family methyltransferase